MTGDVRALLFFGSADARLPWRMTTRPPLFDDDEEAEFWGADVADCSFPALHWRQPREVSGSDVTVDVSHEDAPGCAAAPAAEENDDADEADGRGEYACHRFILAASSEYFRTAIAWEAERRARDGDGGGGAAPAPRAPARVRGRVRARARHRLRGRARRLPAAAAARRGRRGAATQCLARRLRVRCLSEVPARARASAPSSTPTAPRACSRTRSSSARASARRAPRGATAGPARATPPPTRRRRRARARRRRRARDAARHLLEFEPESLVQLPIDTVVELLTHPAFSEAAARAAAGAGGAASGALRARATARIVAAASAARRDERRPPAPAPRPRADGARARGGSRGS